VERSSTPVRGKGKEKPTGRANASKTAAVKEKEKLIKNPSALFNENMPHWTLRVVSDGDLPVSLFRVPLGRHCQGQINPCKRCIANFNYCGMFDYSVEARRVSRTKLQYKCNLLSVSLRKLPLKFAKTRREPMPFAP